MPSSSKAPNARPSLAKTANAPLCDQFINAKSKEKRVFSQKNHLHDILDKVRDLAASCALYEETWTDDHENKTLIRLIGKVLSVIPTEDESDLVHGAEDRSLHVVRRNDYRPESVHDSNSDEDTLYEPRADVQELSEVPVETASVDSSKALIPVRNRTTIVKPSIPTPADIIDESFFTYEGDGVYTSCVPSATDLGTHKRWHYPSPQAVELKDCGNGVFSTTVVSATGQGKHTRWHYNVDNSLIDASVFNYG